MMLDHSLHKTAEAMIAAAEQGKSPATVLARRCPRIQRQIAQVKRCPAMLGLWGRSVNFDENTHEEIVHPAILQAIAASAGVPMGRRIVHAGLQHTYGYLFSLIETPFGAKRERWTSPDLDDALGFGKPALRAQPAAGTLLSNVTYFLGRIVLLAKRRLNAMRPFVAAAVQSYPYHDLIRKRIIEEVDGDIALQTDLVSFPSPRRDMQSLLIYSFRSARGRVKLFTTFPISASVEDDLLRSTGSIVRIRLRYNAYVPGLLGRELIGRRTIKTEW
jgi:hypothetical protein